MEKSLIALGVIALIYFAARVTVSPYIEFQRNPFKSSSLYSVKIEAHAVYGRIDFITDLHCDALQLEKELIQHGELDNLDYPRIKEANTAMETITIASKSLSGENVKRFFL
ncbi:hypothetical protein SYJ56_16925 [Algoriphagus sp. D3-2-R+10]|uniref:hypothetical protein n=1 Tax=Algoriphagus aurantiacus TaxID=3103948 RepID=UPI002B3B5430|nr:hypothetical protein [Algoriphagus sp. D3-2-R+10]MEB2777003.1 hypothetical protein [Algoriphagus sp. D3-2-R+10]